MIVGKHQKGKTTLLEHLSRVGDFKDLDICMDQPSKEPNATTVGIKIGIWKYCKHKGNPTCDYPIIEFYPWDYTGKVCVCVHAHTQHTRTHIHTHICM